MTTEAIKVEGLKQFNRDLKALDSDLPKAVRLAFNAAVDLVVATAKPGVPSRSGRAARSIKPRSTRTQARVSAGGNKAPYYPWLDFGGRVGRRKAVSRPVLKEGRYLYAAYFQHKRSGDFERVMSEGLVDVARQAGIEVD